MNFEGLNIGDLGETLAMALGAGATVPNAAAVENLISQQLNPQVNHGAKTSPQQIVAQVGMTVDSSIMTVKPKTGDLGPLPWHQDAVAPAKAAGAPVTTAVVPVSAAVPPTADVQAILGTANSTANKSITDTVGDMLNQANLDPSLKAVVSGLLGQPSAEQFLDGALSDVMNKTNAGESLKSAVSGLLNQTIGGAGGSVAIPELWSAVDRLNDQAGGQLRATAQGKIGYAGSEGVVVPNDCVAATFALGLKQHQPEMYQEFETSLLAGTPTVVNGNTFSLDAATLASIKALPTSQQGDAAATAAMQMFAADACGGAAADGSVDMRGVIALETTFNTGLKFGTKTGEYALVRSAQGDLHLTQVMFAAGGMVMLQDAFGESLRVPTSALVDANNAYLAAKPIGSTGAKASTLTKLTRPR